MSEPPPAPMDEQDLDEQDSRTQRALPGDAPVSTSANASGETTNVAPLRPPVGGTGDTGRPAPSEEACAGCNVAGECVPSGTLGPTPCLICDPQRARDSWSANDGASCDDGQFCTIDDQCRDGSCTGQLRACEDGIACNGVSTCDEATDRCTPPTNLCGELERCSSDGRCVPVCDDCECTDDADPSTTLVQHPNFGCGFARTVGGDSWITFDNGVHVDPANGFAWLRMDFFTVAETASACARLDVGGITGWRLPTIDEARSLAEGCPAADACPLSDPACLTQSCIASCTPCRGSEGPNAGNYCRAVMTFCTEVHTSSTCPDCPDPTFEWTYGPANANFLPSDPNRRINAYCFRTGIEL